MDELRKAPGPFTAEQARQGEIILKRPWERVLFIAGLVAAVVLAAAAVLWLG
jgi:hypothetical protein